MNANGDGATLNQAVQNAHDEIAMRAAHSRNEEEERRQEPPPAGDGPQPTTHRNVEQRTDAWHQLRAGKPTASRFDAIMKKSKRDGKPLKARSDLLFELAAERIAGPRRSEPTPDMARGIALEPYCLEIYRTMRPQTEIDTSAAYVSSACGRFGASPDAMLDADGLLEIKTSAPHIYIEDLRRGQDQIPARFKWQMIGQCLTTGRDWCALLQYCEPLQSARILYLTPTPDELEELSAELDTFCNDLDALTAEMRTLIADHCIPVAEIMAVAESEKPAGFNSEAPAPSCDPPSLEQERKEQLQNDREKDRDARAWQERWHGMAQAASNMLLDCAAEAVAAGNCKTRVQKAVGIARSITKMENAQREYLAYMGGCTCPDARAGRARKCKHQLAAIMLHNVTVRLQNAATHVA